MFNFYNTFESWIIRQKNFFLIWSSKFHNLHSCIMVPVHPWTKRYRFFKEYSMLVASLWPTEYFKSLPIYYRRIDPFREMFITWQRLTIFRLNNYERGTEARQSNVKVVLAPSYFVKKWNNFGLFFDCQNYWLCFLRLKSY